jgi:hypothetical protein
MYLLRRDCGSSDSPEPIQGHELSFIQQRGGFHVRGEGDKVRSALPARCGEVLRLKDGLAVLTSEDGSCTVCTGASTILLYEKLERSAFLRARMEDRRPEEGNRRGNSL